MIPGANPAKRILMMAGSTADPDELYAAVEVGGLIRSLDGGEHWDNLSHGLYMNDDIVDTHGVLASSVHHGSVFSISRAGMFHSNDRGDHWLHVPIEPLNQKGQTYCRDIHQVPGDPDTIWMAGGANFQSDLGALFRSGDAGMNWGNVLMTPHVAVKDAENIPERRFQVLMDNARLFLNEEPLNNIVDKSKWY